MEGDEGMERVAGAPDPLPSEAASAAVRSDGFRPRGEQDRLTDLIDAAYGFAVTLLLVAADQVPASVDDLVDTMRRIPAALFAFTMVVLFWRAHVRWHRRYGLDDRRSVLLSLALVFLALVYVFPLRLISAGFFSWVTDGSLSGQGAAVTGPDDVRVLFAGYALAFASLSAVLALLYAHAYRQRTSLELSLHERAETAAEVVTYGSFAATGVVSLLMAATLPTSAIQIGVPGWIYFLLCGLGWLSSTVARARRKRS